MNSTTHNHKTICLVLCFHIPKLLSIWVYPAFSNISTSFWKVRITSCFRPYMPLFILMKMLSLESNSCSKFYFVMISGGKYFIGTFMYSDSFTGDTRKKPFKSQLMNIAPSFMSNMALLINIFVSTRLEVGYLVSSSYLNLSPPTTKRISMVLS